MSNLYIVVTVDNHPDPQTSDWDGSWVDDLNRGICACALVRATVELTADDAMNNRSLEMSFTVDNALIYSDEDTGRYAAEAAGELTKSLINAYLWDAAQGTPPVRVDNKLTM